jgi:GNAT superfamily N-acetyltransferase
MTIRELDEERDAEQVVALVRDVEPHAVVSRASWLHRLRTVPERAQHAAWVAEVDGTFAGYSFGYLNFFGSGRALYCNVRVEASSRRRGIGAALYERVRTHALDLGAESMLATFAENEAGNAFAHARGFAQVRAEAGSVLDVARVTESPPADVDLRAVADADLRLVYAVDMEATHDIPLTEPVDDDIPYDEWVGHVLEHPLFTADGSFVAMVDGVAAAVSLLLVDGASGRGTSMFTGTLRAYRGRGLALAVKLASVAWAREHGIEQLVTSNDERNAPMLAINRKLGYMPAGRSVEYLLQREGFLRERREDL